MTDFFGLLTAFFVPLFIIVDPVGVLAVFVAITPQHTSKERRDMAARGCSAGFALLLAFILFGQTLLDYFGIGAAAVEICGGILLFVIALEMLYGHPTRTGMSKREKRMAEAMKDVSIVPLGFPLLAGPGAITTCLLFSERAGSITDYAALVTGATLIFTGTYFLLTKGEALIGKLGELGTVLVTRILGLVLAFLATQYAIEGLRTAFFGHL